MAASISPGAPATTRAKSQAPRNTGGGVPGSGIEQPLYAVLAHAVLLVDTDPIEINERANAFEAMIGSGKRYEEMKVVTVAQALAYECFPIPHDLRARVRAALIGQVRQAPLLEP